MDRSRATPDTLIQDMARHGEAREAVRLGRATARPVQHEADDPALEERVEDHLRPGAITALFESAAAAPRGAGGEASRLEFRAVAHAWLERACAEQREELERHAERLEEPERGFEAALAVLESPSERRRLMQDWDRRERELHGPRLELLAAREEAARRAGASSLVVFLGAAQSVDPDEVAETFARGVVAPLDDALRARARERLLRSRLPLSEPLHAADVPVLEWLIEHRERFPPRRTSTCLRRLGPRLRADPDAGDFRLIEGFEGDGRPCHFLTPGGPVIVVGALPGPTALARTLGFFGLSARAAFLRRCCGPGSRWVDPAFEFAAEALFRRLLLCDAFRDWAQLESSEALVADLRLEESVAPRRAWAYLYLVLKMARPSGGPAEEGTIEETLERATGRPVTPGDKLVSLTGDPAGASALRGTAYALLLEERLLTRFGRRWFTEARASLMLRECWEAEPQQTAESMAAALDLGTIEATPLRDRCRP